MSEERHGVPLVASNAPQGFQPVVAEPRPIVGLALGSGGAKGLAHIGVLKALVEHEVPIHVVAGSSMGSLVGAFYATGMRPDFMERLATTLHWRHWVDLTVPRVGLIAGRKIHQLVWTLTRGLDVNESPIPLAIVATELTMRKVITFDSGPIADAVRASISIPGVFVPYVTNSGVYVDGGVVERVPVQAARTLGADFVIGVDVAGLGRSPLPETMLDVVMQSLEIMQEHSNSITVTPDVLIQPDLSKIGASHFQKARDAIAIGYDATLAVMPSILRLLQDTERLHPRATEEQY